MTLMYNGIQYEIEDEGEIEKINIGVEEEDESDTYFVTTDEFQETTWEPNNVHHFLDECIKRKEDLRNPKVRRRKIFADIRERLKTKGYNFRIESLDRKLRNMKIHYLVSRDNNKKSLKRTHWPYYDKMKAIYPEVYCSSRKRPSTTASGTLQPARESHTPPPASPSTLSSPLPSPPPYKISKPSETSKRPGSFFPEEEYQRSRNSYLEYPNKMERLRRQILSFEERRTVAAEKILKELRESNRLKRELLELNIKMFKAERELEEE